MVYLEYESVSGQVVQIHKQIPVISPGYSYASSDQFSVGDEFESTIWVLEVDKEATLIGFSAIRNNPNAQRLLRENNHLQQENTLLKAQNQALTERADFIEDVVAEMAAQVYQ